MKEEESVFGLASWLRQAWELVKEVEALQYGWLQTQVYP